jgi:hypothetical protein
MKKNPLRLRRKNPLRPRRISLRRPKRRKLHVPPRAIAGGSDTYAELKGKPPASARPRTEPADGNPLYTPTNSPFYAPLRVR